MEKRGINDMISCWSNVCFNSLRHKNEWKYSLLTNCWLGHELGLMGVCCLFIYSGKTETFIRDHSWFCLIEDVGKIDILNWDSCLRQLTQSGFGKLQSSAVEGQRPHSYRTAFTNPRRPTAPGQQPRQKVKGEDYPLYKRCFAMVIKTAPQNFHQSKWLSARHLMVKAYPSR